MNINCIVVDDEQYARKLLTGYIGKIPHLQIAGEAKNAMEAMQILQAKHVDLMFLDIQMPDLTGLELMKTLQMKPVVIFTTAYKEFALEGYVLDVVDYMLKPIAFERFVQGVNKAVEQIRLKTLSGTAILQVPVATGKDFITLKADYKVHKVMLNDILYIEGLKEYVTFYTRQRKFVVLESLHRLEQTLPVTFLRIHKSYIVNATHVDALNGNQVEIGKVQIPIGKSYIENVKAKIFG